MEEGSEATFMWLPEHHSFADLPSSGGGCAVWGCIVSLNTLILNTDKSKHFKTSGKSMLGELLPSHQASR